MWLAPSDADLALAKLQNEIADRDRGCAVEAMMLVPHRADVLDAAMGVRSPPLAVEFAQWNLDGLSWQA